MRWVKWFYRGLSILSVMVAGWMVWHTHQSFPNEPFADLVPGYVIFPMMALLPGLFSLIRSLTFSDGKTK